MTTPLLLPQHQRLIDWSGISPAVAAERGYRSVERKADLQARGFSANQCRVPALLIPIRNTTGEIVSYQIRPDEPRIDRQGKPLKYETPAGGRMVLDVPGAVRSVLADPRHPLVITEGARKVDAAVSKGIACIGVLGVFGWRGTNDQGGKTRLPELETIALNGRDVYLAFDSDVTYKPEVQSALRRLGGFLESRDARVHIILLPAGPSGVKVGLDDFLAAGHDWTDLLAVAVDALPTSPNGGRDLAYEETDNGLVWHKPTRDGTAPVPLTNFKARIVASVTEDDGAELRRLMEIEATLRGRTTRFTVPAARFDAMNWPIEYLGPSAVVYPGLGVQDHARAAIQLVSEEISEHTVYNHTGWRRIGDAWVYLHADEAVGPIGPIGPVSGVEVRLPSSLTAYRLPAPPEAMALAEAVRASLNLIEVASEAITVPTYGAIYRSVLGPSDFSLHLAGPTGAGKSVLGALAQQHFGPDMDARKLPGSWSSTPNALEALAFHAKDALLVVDDFVPTGSQADVQRQHREADRLLRGQGNNSGRLRMRPDSSLRAAKPPRGLMFSTGEDVPRGQSLRARLFVLEIGPTDLNWARVTTCQQDAANGLLALAMSGFLRWLAARYEQIRSLMAEEVRALRERAAGAGSHRRTPEIVANLMIGLRYFLRYAVEVGAVTVEEASRLDAAWWAALGVAAGRQAEQQEAAESTSRFQALLRASLASGEAHVAGPDGREPESPAAWGWRPILVGGVTAREEWRPQGRRIGWVDGEDLYLEPEASFAVVQRLGNDSGEPILVTSTTLRKRLKEQGLLRSFDSGRGKLTTRRTLEGRRLDVLHVTAAWSISTEPAQSAQPAHEPVAVAVASGGEWAEV